MLVRSCGCAATCGWRITPRSSRPRSAVPGSCCVAAARNARAKRAPRAAANIDGGIGELIWRDFYQMLLEHFPRVAHEPFVEAGKTIAYARADAAYAAWCAGTTGYPIVDAAMIQLNTTGWMHNRLRMIVASFLTKQLLIDYHAGERYFEQHLADADLAANNGGWQWSASTGTDAAPYFRVFNPTLQGAGPAARARCLRCRAETNVVSAGCERQCSAVDRVA